MAHGWAAYPPPPPPRPTLFPSPHTNDGDSAGYNRQSQNTSVRYLLYMYCAGVKESKLKLAQKSLYRTIFIREFPFLRNIPLQGFLPSQKKQRMQPKHKAPKNYGMKICSKCFYPLDICSILSYHTFGDIFSMHTTTKSSIPEVPHLLPESFMMYSDIKVQIQIAPKYGDLKRVRNTCFFTCIHPASSSSCYNLTCRRQ